MTKDDQRISRKKFLQGVALAGGLGAVGVALPESMVRPVLGTTTRDPDPANYIVDIESGTIKAYNGLTGLVDSSDTQDAGKVIQYAIDHLTSGRTWKEKVVIKGNMTFPPNPSSPVQSLTIPSFTIVEHLGRLSYTGSGSAMIIQEAYNVELHSPTIDLAGAGLNAVGIEIQGLWHGDIYSPRVENGAGAAITNGNAVGIKIQTSKTGGDKFGAYIISIYDPGLESFTGLHAFQTLQTPGDDTPPNPVEVTHLAVYGGYIHASGDVFLLRKLASSKFQGMATGSNAPAGTVTNAFNVDTTHDTTFSPGEFENFLGYGFVFYSGCSYLWVDAGDFPVKPAQGLINENPGYYLPNMTRGVDTTGTGNHIRLFPSRSDPLYYARFSTNYNYGEVFHIAVKGGGAERKILRWGDAAGLVLGTRKEGPADPTSSDYPNDGDWGIYRNSSNGNIYLVTNIYGAIRKITLT